jgi:hypothetical protein
VNKNYIALAFLLIFLLGINFIAGMKSVYYLLLLILLGVLLFRIDDIKELIA